MTLDDGRRLYNDLTQGPYSALLVCTNRGRHNADEGDADEYKPLVLGDVTHVGGLIKVHQEFDDLGSWRGYAGERAVRDRHERLWITGEYPEQIVKARCPKCHRSLGDGWPAAVLERILRLAAYAEGSRWNATVDISSVPRQ